MSESYSVAIIGAATAILAALLTAYFQPRWAKGIERKSALRVTIKFYTFELTKFLEDSLRNYMYNKEMKPRPTTEAREIYQNIILANGYADIQVVNDSKISIGDVAVIFNDLQQTCFEIAIDGEWRGTKAGTKAQIGTLQPGSKAEVRVWTVRNYAEKSFGAWRDAIRVTAQQYDQITLSYPPAQYFAEDLKNKASKRSRKKQDLLFICVMLAMIGIPAALVIAEKKTSKTSLVTDTLTANPTKPETGFPK